MKATIVEVCQRLWARNMLAAADGNVSARISDHEILITPTGVSKARMNAADMAVINLEGEVLEGKPSGERLMHLEVYRRVRKARAIVHAHPPTAIAWSIARPDLNELPCESLSEVILAVGRIPIVPYARPGTREMGTVLSDYLPDCRVMILGRHGALSWGETLEEAELGMERLEHSAQILKLAHELGGITKLPPQEIEYLKNLRLQMGERSL